MGSRPHISLKVKLASTLLALGHVSYEDSKSMTANQICSLYQFDHHPIRYADGGSNHPSNLTPRLIIQHREKTKSDATERSKERKIRRAIDKHAQKMLLKPNRHGVIEVWGKVRSRWPKRKIPSRSFPK